MTTEFGFQSRRRSGTWRVGALITSLALAAYVFFRGWDELQDSAEIGIPTLTGLIAAQFVYLFSQSERLRLIVSDHAGERVYGVRWLRIFLVGRLLNGLFVQTGNVYRLMTLRSQFDIPASRFASSLTAQMWLSVATALLMAAVFSATEPSFGLGSAVTVALALLALVVALTPFVAKQLSSVTLRKLGYNRIINALDAILDRTTTTVRSGRLVFQIMVYVLLGFAAGALILRLSYTSAGAELSWSLAAALLAMLQVSNVIVITPGNLGVQELGFAALSGLLGYPGATGVLASGIVRASGLVAVAVATGSVEIAFRFRQRRNSESLQRHSRE